MLFFGFILCVFTNSQQKPDLKKVKTLHEKLTAWENYCKSISNAENYSQLIAVADEGIKMAENNENFLGSFYFYKGYGYEYTNNQYQKATICYEKSLQLAQKNKNLKLETSDLMRLNYMYYSIKEHEKGKQLIEHIKKVVDTIKDKDSKATLLGSLGEYYLDRSEFENFITYKLKAINLLLSEKNRDELKNNNIGVSYLQISDAYNDMKQYEKAVEYCKYSEPYLNREDGFAFLCNSYIEAFTHLDDLKSAQKYYKKLYELARGNSVLDLNVSYGNRNMAEYYLQKNRLELAHDFANKALYFGRKSQDEEILMEANVVKGKILFAEKKYQKAIDQLNLALKFAFLYDKRFFIEINKKISESYAALHQWKKAYEYHEIYSITSDSLFLESGKQSLANAEATFQNKNKQKEIKTLSALNIEHERNIANAKKQRIYLVSGLFLIAIIGGLLYYQSQNRKKINGKLSKLNLDLENANKTKMQFFGILNHDLRSPVVGLIHFLHLQKESPELLDQATKERLENQSFKAAENLLVQMEDLLLWCKGQMDNFEPEKKLLTIENIFNDIKDNFSWVDHVKFSFENPEQISVFTDKEYLKTITRNLTNNAIKILEKIENPAIIWSAINHQNSIELKITDNGIGAMPEKFRALFDENVSIGIKSGLGMHLIRDLSKAIDAKISVNSKENMGTSISIMIHKPT
jgi:signal transduction histidine kinase